MALPGFRNHPKFRRLVAALRIPEAHVLGHVEMMWEVCYESGNPVLGDDVDVELAAGWVGEQGAFCQAMLTCGGKTRAGLIEETEPGSGAYQVHDLADHAPGYVENRAKRSQESQKDKTCLRCGTTFRSSDSRSRFCDDACRKADYRDRLKDGHVPDCPESNPGQSGTHSGQETDSPGHVPDCPESGTDVPIITRPDQTSPERKEVPPAEVCTETPEAPPPSPSSEAPPVVVLFPCEGKGSKLVGINQQQIDEWQKDFPGVDVPQQLRSMRAWLMANPTKRKTARGTPAFVVRWLAKEQDHPKGLARAAPAGQRSFSPTPELDRDYEQQLNAAGFGDGF